MNPRTLDDWLAWQNLLHTQEIDLGLDRVRKVWMNLPRSRLPGKVITVAGTNGKGSSVAFLEAILEAAGYRTGCYTSPHLLRYNERIRLRGEETADALICESFERVEAARGDTPLTFFEFGTLAALDIFSRSELDAVVLEVGLGGRLDAVNIIDADVVLISTVDLDHAEWLGSTRDEVALEKAGIMREGRPAVYAGTAPPASLVRQAQRIGARLYLARRDYHWAHEDQQWRWWSGEQRRHGLPLPSMRGEHQLRNAAACLMILRLLARELPVDQQAVRTGLRSASLPGRFQVVGRDPQLILDVAHNGEAAASLAENLGSMYCGGRTRAVFALLSDKDIEQVVGPVADLVDDWYLGALDNPRALRVPDTAAWLARLGIDPGSISCDRTVVDALTRARRESSKADRILVFGSFFTVADALGAIERGSLAEFD